MCRTVRHFFVSILIIAYCTTYPTYDSTTTPTSAPFLTPEYPDFLSNKTPQSKRFARKKYTGKQEAHYYAGNIVHDVFSLHKNIIHPDTLKIASILCPLFVGARMIDEQVQSNFYDKEHHKNIPCIPERCHDIAQWSIAIPVVGLGSQAFLGSSEEMRETSRAYLIGLPFVFWTKTLIKKIPFEANMRPWHEHYSCEKRSTGGFPSGHMAEATYTALLYGLKFGAKFAVPLGLLATFIGASFIACNRHYLSQIVAGAGLGAVYSLAAYKLSDSRIKENLQLSVKFENRRPALAMSYTW